MLTWHGIAIAIHITLAMLWWGAGVYHSLFVASHFRNESATSRKYWSNTKHGMYFGLTGIGTVLFGLLAMFAGTYDSAALGNGFLIFNIGAGLGVAALLVGLLGHMPLMIKTQKAAMAGEAYIHHVEKDHKLDRVSMVLLSFAVACMLLFRLF